jgi:alanine dehydrogenase
MAVKEDPMLFLTEEQVADLVGVSDALEVVEASMREQAEGLAANMPRQRVRMPTGTLHLMAGALAGPQRFGFKAYTTFRGYIKFHVFLYDREQGNLLAIMEGDRLGQVRTGAASGVATKYLASPLASKLAVIGTGWQAQTQLKAICSVRHISEVKVFSRDPERRRKFAEEMSERHQVPVRPAESIQAAVEDADIVVTITTARNPVLHAGWIKPGAHVTAAGSNTLVRRELDEDLVAQFDFVCVDSLEQAHLESGDLLVPIEKGLLCWDGVHKLSDVVAGRLTGRKLTHDRTLFKSHGIAIWDIALASLVYERAMEQGVGASLMV